MDIGVVEQLTSPRGWALLNSLPAYSQEHSLALGASLREAGYEPDLVAAALTQSRLRARARAKLGDFADGMLFTADGLEQATRLEVAARHAERYRSAGITHVWDLGCGLGADAMAAAALGLGVTAVERDPVTAAMAAINLRHFDTARALTAAAADVLAEIPTDDGIWFDPARRRPGVTDDRGRTRRTFRLADLSPSFDVVLAAAARVPATGAKLSPALPHAAIPAGCEAQWTSYAGEVLECALWWGPLVARPGRSALILRPATVDRGAAAHLVTEADTDPAAGGLGPVASRLPQPGEALFDPDRALLAAGLVGALTAATDGAELGHGVGYVVAGRAPTLPYARRYRVLAAMPLQVKPVRAWLRARGVGRLVIKKRGVRIDPDQLRRDLRLSGAGAELICVLTRVGERPAFIAVEPDADVPASPSCSPASPATDDLEAP